MQTSIFGAPVPSQDKLGGLCQEGIQHKNGGDGRDGAPISLDGVAVHPDCWCVCLCYLHVTSEIQKMAKFTFWYQLTRVVPDKVQRAVSFCVNMACWTSYFALWHALFCKSHMVKVH